MRHKFICGLGLFMLLFTLTCFSQQEYVSRFDAFGSYSFLSTPLTEPDAKRIQCVIRLERAALGCPGWRFQRFYREQYADPKLPCADGASPVSSHHYPTTYWIYSCGSSQCDDLYV